MPRCRGPSLWGGCWGRAAVGRRWGPGTPGRGCRGGSRWCRGPHSWRGRDCRRRRGCWHTLVAVTINDSSINIKVVTMETFFGKRSLLINIKIKAVMNKNIFYAIFRFISLNHFQVNFFIKYWEIFFFKIFLSIFYNKNFATIFPTVICVCQVGEYVLYRQYFDL